MSCIAGCGNPARRSEGGALFEVTFCDLHADRFLASAEYRRMIYWSAITPQGRAAVCDFARRTEKEDRIDFARSKGAPEGLTP